MRLPFISEALSQLFSKPSTVKYPYVPVEAPEHYRGRIKFHPETCINCGMCVRVCAGGAIVKEVEKTEEGDHVTMTFYMDSCTFCGMCADFCSRNSIELTKDYAMVATDPNDLIETGSFLKKPPVKKTPPAAAPAAAKVENAPAAAGAAEAKKEAEDTDSACNAEAE